MTNAEQNTHKVNPRSTGISNSTTYEKHTNERSLKPEAEELLRCQTLGIQTEHVGPVEILSFDERTNRLTTRKANAKELFHTVWNATYLLGRLKGHKLNDPDVVTSRIVELGTWLRKYHDSSRTTHADGNGSWLEGAFHRKIKDIRDDRLLPEEKIQKIEKRFGKELEKLHQPGYLAEFNAFPCKIHGDFIIYNVMVDEERNLHIVDFGDTRVSGNLEDVSRMYSSLWAIADTNRIRRRLLEGIPEQFLQAYGYSPDIVETPYFQCNLAYNFLVHLEGQYYMRDMLSWTSYREMSQITKAGIRWINRHL